MSSDITHRINVELGISVRQIAGTLRLLDERTAIPFIARYRKDATGNLREGEIREISERYSHYRALDARREAVLSAINEQGRLTGDVRDQIAGCFDKNELEDLFLPYRPKRKSKANIARQRGLEPLADAILLQTDDSTPQERAFDFLSFERRVPTIGAAIEGAVHIMADRVAEDRDYRKWIRNLMLKEGKIRSRVVKGRKDAGTKYSMYHDYEEPVSRIPPHRMLAIRRAAKEKILTYSIEIDREKALSELKSRFVIKPDSPWGVILEQAIEDGYRRLLEPSIENEVRDSSRSRAEREAIGVFQENLRFLLLSPPAGQIPVLGIEPGMGAGFKIAAVDPVGNLLEHQTLRLTESQSDLEAAESTLVDLLKRTEARGVAVGNGPGSRETEDFVRTVIAKHAMEVFVAVSSESGASGYSSSKKAREEFPKLNAAVRSAISIARRLRDPLSEWVKMDPASIGIGQYKHDLDRTQLNVMLRGTVEAAVNYVGADLNTASVDYLSYISGISRPLARSIVQWRTNHGEFASRQQLLEMENFDQKTFDQAAGFLRISKGSNPLDRTAIHPESYSIVEQMAASIGTSVSDLLEDSGRIQSIQFADFETQAGRFALNDIREELLRPGRDPRERFVVPRYRDDVRTIADLKDGMELEGRVTNVTDFGAFVDLGVHQDGLVHISELSHHYVADARQRVHVGEVMKVKVIAVDPSQKRISLSVKATLPKPRPRPRPQAKADVKQRPKAVALRGRSKLANGKPKTREAAVKVKPVKTPPKMPELSMEEKIRQLQEKFRGPNR